MKSLLPTALFFTLLTFAAPTFSLADTEAKTYFTPEEIQTGKQYSNENLGFWAAGVALEIVFWVAILATGFAMRLEKFLLQLTGERFWAAALIFFAVVFILQFAVSYPLSYFRGFRHEHAYGLSNLTFAGWNIEKLKGLAVWLVIAVPGFTALFLAIRLAPVRWWLWASGVFGFILLVMIELWPVLVNPLFNKFTPLPEGPLRIRLLSLAEKAGMKVDAVFVMDASKQTKHTNAYFTGLAKSRRIVLYDNLLRGHTDDEVETILAHEIGHWKHNHVWKGIAMTVIGVVLFFFIADWTLGFCLARNYCGITVKHSLAAAPILFLLISILPLATIPMESAISRQFERTADRESLELSRNPAAFIASMQKLAKENLSDVEPSPLKEWIFYSHPSIMNRIRTAENFKAVHCP